MSIVNILVSVTRPPKPSDLLKSGVLVSVGGTTLAAGQTSLLTAAADLTPILSGSKALTSLAFADGVVTATTTQPHGWTNGSTHQVVIAGVTPAGYNGTFTATVTGNATFTYPLAQSPGNATAYGTVTAAGSIEIQQMNTAFWAQGKQRSVYVLELGAVSTADAIAALSDFIVEDVALGNTYQNYFTYLVPRAFDAEADFQALCNGYNGNSDMVYFFVTSTVNTYAAWTALAQKSVYLFVESPAAVGVSFDCAAHMQSALNNNPGSANLVPPMSYRFTYGTTVYPPKGNATLLKQLQADNVNYVGSAAEGGLSNMMIVKGHLQDGNPFNFWYSVAWCIINLELNIANAIINGSNTTANPLYYNQDGIDRLQKVSLATLRSGISFGLLLGTAVSTKLPQTQFNENYNNGDYNGEAVVNAIPFTDYTTDNPDAYQEGDYGGLSAVVTPKRGFESITFNLSVTNFVG